MNFTKKEKFTNAVKSNDIKTVASLINDKEVFLKEDDFIYATTNGFIDIVKLFLKDNNTNYYDNDYILCLAVKNNYIDILELFLNDNRFNPANKGEFALNYAAETGNLEIAKLLLEDKRVNPSHCSSKPLLISAASHNCLDVVKLLLKDKRVDPSEEGNLAIINAFKNSNFEIVQLLWNDKRVQNSLKNNDIEFHDKLFKQSINQKIKMF